MIEQLVQQVALLKFIERMTGWLNRIPVPYLQFPVRAHGCRLAAHTLDRYLALWFWKLGLWERTELKLLRGLGRPGMLVVDIGANIGFHTLALAQQVGPQGHVWAFEPDPGNFAALQQNIHANRAANVSAVNSAAGSTSGQSYLYLSQAHHGDHRTYGSDAQRNAIPIQTVALDQFFPTGQRIDLIKMDIQGAEGQALAGMQTLLKNNPGVIMLMEFWPMGLRQAGSSPEQILIDLQALGFTIEWIDQKSGTLRSAPEPKQLAGALRGKQQANLVIRPASA